MSKPVSKLTILHLIIYILKKSPEIVEITQEISPTLPLGLTCRLI